MSFLFLLLFIICTYIRPQEWVPGMMGWPLVNILAVLTLIGLIFERNSSGKKLFLNVPQNKIMIAFFGSILMSHIANTYLWGLRVAFFDFLPILILFYLTLNGIDIEKKFKTSFWLIVVLSLILVLQGHYQIKNFYGWAGQSVTLQMSEEGQVQRINWIGVFGDPNDLALTFVIAVGFLLPFIFGRCKTLSRLVSLGGVAALLYGLILTNSRGGILALIATGFFFFVRKTRKFVLGSIVGGGMGFLFLLIAPSRMSELSSSEASASSRLDLWYNGMQMFKHNLFFGRGYNMFMDDMAQTAHNSYVLAASELGTLGLVLWVGLLYIAIKQCWIVQDKNKELTTYALAMQSSIVGFSAAAFFLSRTYNILPFLLVALSGSLFYVAKQKDNTIVCSVTNKDWRNIIFISVFSIVSVYFFIRVR